MACIRCGVTEQIEKHHKRQRVHGGGDEAENMENLCRPCHKFEHTFRYLVASLEKERWKRNQPDRIRVLQLRIDVLNELNTPELIRERKTYISYWTNSKTHHLPRGIPTKEDKEVNRMIQKALEELANK